MIHVIIKSERRVSMGEEPRELAITCKRQLHMLASRITDPSNLLYAAEWDGRSPWITVSLGAISDLKMAYFGFPMVTKEEWDLQNPPAL